jgi:hypothetical protein
MTGFSSGNTIDILTPQPHKKSQSNRYMDAASVVRMAMSS